jgi:hypothetical protein
MTTAIVSQKVHRRLIVGDGHRPGTASALEYVVNARV